MQDASWCDNGKHSLSLCHCWDTFSAVEEKTVKTNLAIRCSMAWDEAWQQSTPTFSLSCRHWQTGMKDLRCNVQLRLQRFDNINGQYLWIYNYLPGLMTIHTMFWANTSQSENLVLLLKCALLETLALDWTFLLNVCSNWLVDCDWPVKKHSLVSNRGQYKVTHTQTHTHTHRIAGWRIK